MRLCGICIDAKPIRLKWATQSAEDDDIHDLYTLAANSERAIMSIEQVESPYIAEIDGEPRLCLYTDGSCKYPKHPTFAHAGWGIAASPHYGDSNHCGPVKGIIQTSYRAELRAVAQVVALYKCPVLICSDCKAVVNQLQQYLDDTQRPARSAAPQLWDFIYNVLDQMPSNKIPVKRVPGHLDSDDNKHKNKNT